MCFVDPVFRGVSLCRLPWPSEAWFSQNEAATTGKECQYEVRGKGEACEIFDSVLVTCKALLLLLTSVGLHPGQPANWSNWKKTKQQQQQTKQNEKTLTTTTLGARLSELIGHHVYRINLQEFSLHFSQLVGFKPE